MGFIIWSIIAFIFVGIGISCWNSKEAIGFFTFVKPPQISSENVINYNHAVSILWFIFAALLESIGLPLLFAEQNSPIFIFVVFGCVALIIALLIAYLRIEAHYKK